MAISKVGENPFANAVSVGGGGGAGTVDSYSKAYQTHMNAQSKAFSQSIAEQLGRVAPAVHQIKPLCSMFTAQNGYVLVASDGKMYVAVDAMEIAKLVEQVEVISTLESNG